MLLVWLRYNTVRLHSIIHYLIYMKSNSNIQEKIPGQPEVSNILIVNTGGTKKLEIHLIYLNISVTKNINMIILPFLYYIL